MEKNATANMGNVVCKARLEDLLHRISTVESRVDTLSSSVSSQDSAISEMNEEFIDTRDRLDDISDLITGKIDMYSGLSDERNGNRWARDKEYSSWKYVFGNVALCEDEDGCLQREAYADTLQERLDYLEELVLKKVGVMETRLDSCEKRIDALHENMSEMHTEMELMMELFASAFRVKIMPGLGKTVSMRK